MYSINPTTAEHEFARIEHRALARRDGALRFVEAHLNARRIAAGKNRRTGGAVLVADPHLGARRFGRWCDRDPINILDVHRAAEQLFTAPDDYASCGGLG